MYVLCIMLVCKALQALREKGHYINVCYYYYYYVPIFSRDGYSRPVGWDVPIFSRDGYLKPVGWGMLIF